MSIVYQACASLKLSFLVAVALLWQRSSHGYVPFHSSLFFFRAIETQGGHRRMYYILKWKQSDVRSRTSSSQAAYDTPIALTMGFMSPHEEYMFIIEANKIWQLWNSGVCIYIWYIYYSGVARSFTTSNYVNHFWVVLLPVQWSYYLTLLLVIIESSFSVSSSKTRYALVQLLCVHTYHTVHEISTNNKGLTGLRTWCDALYHTVYVRF